MPAAILSILMPLIPYILLAIGAVAAFIGIKQRGVQQERDRQQKAQQKAVEQVQRKVDQAVAKDAQIDKQVEAKKDEIVKQIETPDLDVSPGDKFKF